MILRPLLTGLIMASALATPLFSGDSVIEAFTGTGLRQTQINTQFQLNNQTMRIENWGMVHGWSGDLEYMFIGFVSNSNNNNNQNPQAQQNAAGEYIFSGSAGTPGLTLIRRIKIDPQTMVNRCVDILVNTTQKAIKTTYRTHITFNTTPTGMITEKGPLVAGPLPLKHSAIAFHVINNYGNNPAPTLWVLCDPGARLRPTIAINGNSVESETACTVAPGRAVAFASAVIMQIGIDTPAGMTTALRTVRQRAFMADLPPAVRKALINWRPGSGGGDDEDPPNFNIPQELLDQRSDQDLLTLGQTTRLRGGAGMSAGATVAITTALGAASIPFADVLALAGRGDGGIAPRLYVRGGEVLSGALSGNTLRFQPGSGGELTIAVERIGWLVLRNSNDGDHDLRGSHFLTTRDGMRLLIHADSTHLRLATPWGRLDVLLSQVVSLTMDRENYGHLLRLADGTRMPVMPSDETMVLRTSRFGERSIRLDEIIAIGKRTLPSESAPTEITDPWLNLGDMATVIGVVDAPLVHLRTDGTSIPVIPNQVRTFAAVDSENPRLFQADLWNSDKVVGTLEETVIPVSTKWGRLLIPADEVSEIHIPTPTLSPKVRAAIAVHITDLGHREWTKRDAASKALATIGDAARPQLEEALRQTTDAEVRRRLEILSAGK